MNSESRMTIVVPVLNREATLQRTLDSISGQTARPLSVIIVDNGSTDNSRDIASRWMSRHKASDFDITLLDMPEKGVSKARNLGLREAVTPYIMFFDSDDTMSPHHVEDIMTEFAADPTLDIVGRDVRLHTINGSTRTLPFADSDLLFQHIFYSILSTQRYALRTSLLHKAGGWNEDATVWTDYELGLRLIMENPKVKRINREPAVDVYQQPDSITTDSYSKRDKELVKSFMICNEMLSGNMPLRDLKMLDLKGIVLAGNLTRAKSPEGRRLLVEILDFANGPFEKIGRYACYLYTALGGRGIHRIAYFRHSLKKCLKSHRTCPLSK